MPKNTLQQSKNLNDTYDTYDTYDTFWKIGEIILCPLDSVI